MVLFVGTKMTCFISLSTMTRMAENPNPFDLGSCLMKSMDIEDQGWAGIGSCFSFPYGLWQGALALAQLVQDFT